MRFNLLMILFFSFLAFASAQDCRFKNGDQLRTFLKSRPDTLRPLIMAHRGGAAPGFPENALATFQRTAKAIPCPLIEFDVRMTSDSVLVLMHDDNLAIHTNSEGRLSKRTWESVRNLKLKDVKGVASTFPIPTLDEVLRWAQEQPVILVVDSKPGTDIRRVAAQLENYKLISQAVFICYSVADAKKIHKLKPDLTLALGINSVEAADKLTTTGLPLTRLVSLAPRQKKGRQASYFSGLHRFGIPCSYQTNGQTDKLPIEKAIVEYKTLFEAGVDIICTDRPIEVWNAFSKK